MGVGLSISVALLAHVVLSQEEVGMRLLIGEVYSNLERQVDAWLTHVKSALR